MTNYPIPGRRVRFALDAAMIFQPGDYGRNPRTGTWFARIPEEGWHTGSMEKHEVVEHEDGTITVSPSILHEEADGRTWHGWLIKGIWKLTPDP